MCMDLIGPYQFSEKENKIELLCLTMIDPATGWFDIVEIPNKRTNFLANYLEFHWLTRHPWPTEIFMDRAKEFAKVHETIKNDCSINKKLDATRNPQANAIVGCVHQTHISAMSELMGAHRSVGE